MVSKPNLLLTMGDINGIGPEILSKALSHDAPWAACTPIVLGCAAAYEEARKETGAGPPAKQVESVAQAASLRGAVGFLSTDTSVPDREPGRLDPEAGRAAMEWIEGAVGAAMAGEVDGIVTCPINKEGIHLAGYTVSGHTDFIADLTGTENYWMSLFADSMRIVHISGHMSLKHALARVKRDRIAAAIRVGDEALGRLRVARRRIGVAALNPHAGEAGAFGREDEEEILPAVEECCAEGVDCAGPVSADTIFRQMKDGEFDLVVAMYHDQGHIPLKLIAMDSGVNVTLGIPILRTSVDHGTAYEIAGKGVARDDSLRAAITLAARFAGG